MKHLPPTMRRVVAFLVVLAILPVALLVIVCENISSDFNTATSALINWFRIGRWRDRRKRLRRFATDVRLTADLLVLRWAGDK